MDTYLIIWVTNFEGVTRLENVGNAIINANSENDALRKLILDPNEWMAHFLFKMYSVDDASEVITENEDMNEKFERLSELFDQQDLGRKVPGNENHIQFMNDHVEDILDILYVLQEEGKYFRISEF